jgi:hypothetical protein
MNTYSERFLMMVQAGVAIASEALISALPKVIGTPKIIDGEVSANKLTLTCA